LVYSSLIYPLTSLFHCHFFFFSSRRRHTRCLSDWSSDVCSSDLRQAAPESGSGSATRRGGGHSAFQPVRQTRGCAPCSWSGAPRSEERRVGKGCRCGWWMVRLIKVVLCCG